MEIRVHGRGIRVTDRIRSHAVSKVNRSARYFARLDSVDVTVARVDPPEGTQRFRAEMVTRSARHRISAEGQGDTVQHALDAAADRFARQLRRLGDRLADRRRGRSGEPELRVTPGLETASSPEPVKGVPEIVRGSRPVGKPMTPEDAALVMDEHQYSFFVFMNAENGRTSVLHQRKDGRLGLLEVY